MFHRRGGQVTMINKEINATSIRHCPQGCFLGVLWPLLFCLFLLVPWVGLQYVIGAFPGHTYLLFAYSLIP